MIDIKEEIEDEICHLTVGGEVDASSSIHLDNALGKALENHKKILVDFTDLEYISSAGLGVFMSYLQQIENDKIQLVVFGMKQKVLEIFQILGLDQLINITEDKKEALAKMDNA